MIFTRGDYLSVKLIHGTLKVFGEPSSLRANSLKSSIFLAGLEEYERNIIIDLTGFSKGSMPFRYFVVPLSGVYLKVADDAPLIDKVSSILLTWTRLNLSYAGRLEVICSMAQGIESFQWGSCQSLQQCRTKLPPCVGDFYGEATWQGWHGPQCV